jgi:phage FluMu gp28-like protein
MRKNILYIAILLIALVSTSETTAQEFAKMDVSPLDAAAYPSNWRNADKIVKVIYSRPQLKGRSLSKLAPNDKVWRTGANEAAEITFYKDVTFGGKAVKAGTYSLFTIPSDKNWTVILSKQLNVWGSYFYKKNQDVVRVTGEASKSEKTIEAFSIKFEGEGKDINMFMGWADTIVSVPIKS